MSTSTAALIGDDVVVEFSFTAIGTVNLTDPTTVTVIHRDPFLVETPYVYETDDEVEKLATGQYKFTMRIPEQYRRHYFRAVGDGTVNKAQEVYVEVEESYFADPLANDV